MHRWDGQRVHERGGKCRFLHTSFLFLFSHFVVVKVHQSARHSYSTGFAFRFEHRKWNRGRNGLHQLGSLFGPLLYFLCSNLKANTVDMDMPIMIWLKRCLKISTSLNTFLFVCTSSNVSDFFSSRQHLRILPLC